MCDPRQEVLKAVLLAVIREAMINERECLFYLSNHEVEPFVVGSKQAAIELAYLVTHEMKIKNNWETMVGCFVEWQAEDRGGERANADVLVLDYELCKPKKNFVAVDGRIYALVTKKPSFFGGGFSAVGEIVAKDGKYKVKRWT